MGVTLNGTSQRLDPGSLLTFASSLLTGATISWWAKYTATTRMFLLGNLGASGISGGSNLQSVWAAVNTSYSGGIAAAANSHLIEIGNNADTGVAWRRTQTLNDGNLHHHLWAIRQTGAGGGANNIIEHWVDGVKNTTFTKDFNDGWVAPFSDFSGNVPIGAYREGASTYNYWWNGQLIDVRLYTRALSDSEIGTLYLSRGQDAIKRGLLLWLPLVNSAKDYSANNISVTPVGSPTYTTPFELRGHRRKAG